MEQTAFVATPGPVLVQHIASYPYNGARREPSGQPLPPYRGRLSLVKPAAAPPPEVPSSTAGTSS